MSPLVARALRDAIATVLALGLLVVGLHELDGAPVERDGRPAMVEPDARLLP